MGELFVWMDKNTDLFATCLFLVIGLAIIWWVGPILDAWQYAIVRRLRSDADMIAPNEAGLLPVARTVIETGALVQAGLNLVNPAFVRADARGLLPVNQQLIESGIVAQQALALLAQYVANGQPLPNVPQTVHFAPHYAYRSEVDQLEGAPLPALPAVQPNDFWQLFSAGLLPAHGFLMGYGLEDGHPVTAGWQQLYSALIGGQSGSGKSTLIRNILAQSALQGGRFVVLDKHYGAGEESLGASLEPLRPLMLCDVASSEKQMSDALHFVRDIGERRLSGEDPDKTPLVLVVDETTALLSRSNIADELNDVLGEISQETRKVGVYALCIGQQFSGTTMSTTTRNSFVSMIATRSRREVARVMSGNNEFAKQAETLTTGQAIWMKPDGEVIKIAVPNTTQHHIDLVAQTIQTIQKSQNTQPNALQVVEPLSDPLSDPLSEQLTEEKKGAANLSTKQRHAMILFKAGKNKTQILAEVWEVKGGPPFQKAGLEFDEALRSLIPD